MVFPIFLPPTLRNLLFEIFACVHWKKDRCDNCRWPGMSPKIEDIENILRHITWPRHPPSFANFSLPAGVPNCTVRRGRSSRVTTDAQTWKIQVMLNLSILRLTKLTFNYTTFSCNTTRARAIYIPQISDFEDDIFFIDGKRLRSPFCHVMCIICLCTFQKELRGLITLQLTT